jgi:DNA-binding response OmpR family regulator
MGKKVLIVDDERLIRDLVTFRLESKGFEIVYAENGKQAMERLEQEQPDLLVLDIMMPEMSGIDVCRAIKSKPETRHIKVILLTARVQDTDETEGLAAGADLYLTKPFRPNNLLAKIEALLAD